MQCWPSSQQGCGCLCCLDPHHPPFLAETRIETQHWLSSPQPCSPFQAPLGTTKIWDLVSWQCDECMHSSGICFKLSIKVSTVLEKKNKYGPGVGGVGWAGLRTRKGPKLGGTSGRLFFRLLGSKGRGRGGQYLGPILDLLWGLGVVLWV